jgi:hypothetical protein
MGHALKQRSHSVSALSHVSVFPISFSAVKVKVKVSPCLIY